MWFFGEGYRCIRFIIFLSDLAEEERVSFNQKMFEKFKDLSFDGSKVGLGMDRNTDEAHMNDGTHALHVLDTGDLSERRRASFTARARGAKNLNEVERVCGEVWANV